MHHEHPGISARTGEWPVCSKQIYGLQVEKVEARVGGLAIIFRPTYLSEKYMVVYPLVQGTSE
jgi:hypothetical protein